MTAGRVFLAVWLSACLVFAILPGIDIAVAGLFHVEGQGFVLAESRGLQFNRETLWNLSHVVALLALAFGIHALLTRRERRVPGRVWGFSITLILVAPIGIVNLILKEYWGRARPSDVTEFGGTLAFTPPWEIAGQCQSNCSFVSGEVAAAATLAILIGLFTWQAVPRWGRPLLVAGLVAIALATALLRVSVGRHFLSDVLWSNIIVATVAWYLARAFRLQDVMYRVTPGAVAADARAVGNDLLALARGVAPFAAAPARQVRKAVSGGAEGSDAGSRAAGADGTKGET